MVESSKAAFRAALSPACLKPDSGQSSVWCSPVWSAGTRSDCFLDKTFGYRLVDYRIHHNFPIKISNLTALISLVAFDAIACRTVIAALPLLAALPSLAPWLGRKAFRHKATHKQSYGRDSHSASCHGLPLANAPRAACYHRVYGIDRLTDCSPVLLHVTAFDASNVMHSAMARGYSTNHSRGLSRFRSRSYLFFSFVFSMALSRSLCSLSLALSVPSAPSPCCLSVNAACQNNLVAACICKSPSESLKQPEYKYRSNSFCIQFKACVNRKKFESFRVPLNLATSVDFLVLV